MEAKLININNFLDSIEIPLNPHVTYGQDPVTEDYVYIPEEDVPLASIGTPQTGDATGNHWMMLFMMSLGGMIFLLPDVIHRKKNR